MALDTPASDWVLRWCAALGPGARVLDVACGGGRHARALTAMGLRVTAVDVDAAAVAALRGEVDEAVQADLQNAPWPLANRRFDAVLVTNYLWRPLSPILVDALAPGGRLIHETFSVEHAAIGRPRNPEFLLAPLELIGLVSPALHVLAYEHGQLEGPARWVQRICAVRLDGIAGAGALILAPR